MVNKIAATDRDGWYIWDNKHIVFNLTKLEWCFPQKELKPKDSCHTIECQGARKYYQGVEPTEEEC